MLWRGKSGRMADGERADVTSTARDALSVSLRVRALLGLFAHACYVMLSSFRAHVHSAARIGLLCPPAIGDQCPRLQKKAITTIKKNLCLG